MFPVPASTKFPMLTKNYANNTKKHVNVSADHARSIILHRTPSVFSAGPPCIYIFQSYVAALHCNCRAMTSEMEAGTAVDYTRLDMSILSSLPLPCSHLLGYEERCCRVGRPCTSYQG